MGVEISAAGGRTNLRAIIGVCSRRIRQVDKPYYVAAEAAIRDLDSGRKSKAVPVVGGVGRFSRNGVSRLTLAGRREFLTLGSLFTVLRCPVMNSFLLWDCATNYNTFGNFVIIL